MTDTEINIKIAEECKLGKWKIERNTILRIVGQVFIGNQYTDENGKTYFEGADGHFTSFSPGFLFPPDYVDDLNEMHKAEEALPWDPEDDNSIDRLGYSELLAKTLGANWLSNNAYDMWLITHATARQRAKAFVELISSK